MNTDDTKAKIFSLDDLFAHINRLSKHTARAITVLDCAKGDAHFYKQTKPLEDSFEK